MILKNLIDTTYMTVYGNDNINIVGLSNSSKKIKKGYMFFALEGTNLDGKTFALEAVKNGAVAVVSRYKINLPTGITNIVCADERKAMSDISVKFYDYPAKELFIIGVTGTNGKTTTTYMLESIFKYAGKKVGIIGTNGVKICGEKIVTNMTTPDPILLQEIFAKMRDKGVQIVCMEISAHALELQKIWGIMTDIALFTNLTQDHLDFFLTMEKYGRAKAKLFTREMALVGVVNVEDDFGKKLYQKSLIPILTYARKGCSKNKAAIISFDEIETNYGQEFMVKVLGKKQKIKLNLSGKFNISNALASIGASFIYGLELETIAKGLETLKEVEGRFNFYDLSGVKVVIDYAHTPDGLLNILKSAREITTGKVISVFGCGGNRDSGKRPIMGSISENEADYTFITTDNPRYENPIDIAKEIESGMKKLSHEIEVDREKAIKKAIKKANFGDIVVISGKGAEDYIEICGVKHPYEDKNVILKIKSQFSVNN